MASMHSYLALILLLCCVCPSLAAIDNAVDRAALVELFRATNGTRWLNNSGWLLPGVSMCNWYGITQCDCTTNTSECRVVQIQTGIAIGSSSDGYGKNNLRGTIPDSIGSMIALTNLDMTNNFLTGPIPNSIGNLTRLLSLSLSNNQMTGTIPASIANIPNISTLRLNTNEFSGTLPAELGQCTLMRIFKMYSNRFVGTLPASYGNFSKVETFGVDDNYLIGTIPPSYGNMTALFAMYLYNNSFTGEFPAFFGNATRMYRFMIEDNFFTGTIPDSFVNMTQMVTFNVTNNRLSGSIPSWFNRWPVLQHLKMAANQFTSTIPESIGSISSLLTIDLSGNQLVGTIPYSLRNLARLSTIDFSNNALVSGPSQSFDLLTSTFSPTVVNVSHNRLGPIMQAYQIPANGVVLPGLIDISSNSFQCPYPKNFPSIVVLLRSPCVLQWSTYGIYAGIIIAGILVILMLARVLKNWVVDHLDTRGLVVMNSVFYLTMWSIDAVGLALDIVSLSQILGYLVQSVDNCSPLNEYGIFSKYMSWFPYPVDPGQSNPAMMFLDWYNFYVAQFGLSPDRGAPTLMLQFSNVVCRQLIAECDFDPATTTCYRAHPELAQNGGSAHRAFLIFVIVVAALRGCFELVRAGFVFRSIAEKSMFLGRAGIDFMYSGLFSPLMWPFMGHSFIDQVILYNGTKFVDIVRQLVSVALLSTVPQLLVNLYFLLLVTQVGLETANLLSIFTGILSIVVLLTRGFLLYVQENHADWHSRKDKHSRTADERDAGEFVVYDDDMAGVDDFGSSRCRTSTVLDEVSAVSAGAVPPPPKSNAVSATDIELSSI